MLFSFIYQLLAKNKTSNIFFKEKRDSMTKGKSNNNVFNCKSTFLSFSPLIEAYQGMIGVDS